MEDQREEESNLILRKSFTVVGVVLVILGFYVLATITSLVRAYMAKPDAQNGGIVILSRFVLRHICRDSKTDPSIDHLATLTFDQPTSIVHGPLNSCMIGARNDD
ncbi:hypothetical protein E6H37_00980 [Candidatus Bathyarchaeota archaeon]|nr:MAG: hypothetical protein E6H37_00980 [Candidatus Bathyarchaeota archaeon]